MHSMWERLGECPLRKDNVNGSCYVFYKVSCIHTKLTSDQCPDDGVSGRVEIGLLPLHGAMLPEVPAPPLLRFSVTMVGCVAS